MQWSVQHCTHPATLGEETCPKRQLDPLVTRVIRASFGGRMACAPGPGKLVDTGLAARESFGEHDVPSTLMGVSVLGYPDQLVEIEAVAAAHT